MLMSHNSAHPHLALMPLYQVDGKTLCLLCTIKYKKDQFKKRNGTSSKSAANSSAKRSRNHTSEHMAKKMEAEPGYAWVG